MPEKILIPLDGSTFGEAALHCVEERTSKLSLGEQTEVILFQVISSLTRTVISGDTSVKIPYSEDEMEQMKTAAMNYLNEAGKRLKRMGVTVECRVTVGTSSATEILTAEEEVGADLVAMSTHGRHGLSRWAFGSVTDKVLRGSTVPVLLVRVSKEPE